jgi:acyl-CoA synthetase (AMP-forming)/AMP-acid ligase II
MVEEMGSGETNNFGGQLVQRLTESSCLVDAATSISITGYELRDRILEWANGLKEAGLNKGDRIIIGCTVSSHNALAYLGAIYAGLVAVPVEEPTLAKIGCELATKVDARAIWTERPTQFSSSLPTTILRLIGDISCKSPVPVRPAPCSLCDLAVLMLTSGSTGVPRFVMVNHGNLIANTEAIVRSQGLRDDERAMLILPISYCYGASILHTHLWQGGSVVFDHRFMFPDKILHGIHEWNCTTFAGVPTVFNILLRRSNIRTIPLPKLRRFLQAGGPLGPNKVKEVIQIVPNADFYVMYGQTEATSRITCLDPFYLKEKIGSVGRPLDNLEIRIADEAGYEKPCGETGELWVRGPSVTLGYLDDPEETQRVFQNGWLRTRDLGSVDSDGFVWIQGRLGDFVKMRGIRVSFAEVETRVATVEGVYECAATSVMHPEAGEALVLFIVPDENVNGLVEKVRHSLPTHWVCDTIRLVSHIPKTTNGKIARALLRVDQEET